MTIADMNLLKYALAPETLARYLADAFVAAPTLYVPQIDPCDPQIVLARYKVQILQGNYNFTHASALRLSRRGRIGISGCV
jgi:hypothetical protein